MGDDTRTSTALPHETPRLELENEHLRATVLPDVGAKIYDLILKNTGRQFLWHNPRITPCEYPIDANFDNYWCGGWDEGFPTCDACEYKGESYPNLGELRSLRWTVDTLTPEFLRLSAFGPISPVRAEKTITLAPGSARVSVRSSITNLGPYPLDFIWGTHPALAITPASRFHIPAQTGIVGLSSGPQLGKPGERYRWPFLDTPQGRTDMTRPFPFETSIFGGHYATGIEAGWFALEDTEKGGGILFTFPADLCRWLWLWLVYGGWRGYYHAIIEPWTSYPVHLGEAVKQGTSRKLEPGETFAAEARAAPFEPGETPRDALARALR